MSTCFSLPQIINIVSERMFLLVFLALFRSWFEGLDRCSQYRRESDNWQSVSISTSIIWYLTLRAFGLQLNTLWVANVGINRKVPDRDREPWLRLNRILKYNNLQYLLWTLWRLSFLHVNISTNKITKNKHQIPCLIVILLHLEIINVILKKHWMRHHYFQLAPSRPMSMMIAPSPLQCLQNTGQSTTSLGNHDHGFNNQGGLA